jgi:hypothetical protein
MRRLAALVLLLTGLCVPRPAWSQPPDFRAFRATVEPIFLQPRVGNSAGPGGSCFLCHTRVTSRLRLQSLPPGAIGWTEEQSRKNHAAALRLIVPGDPLKSRLLLHPLSAEAGGDPLHAGGKYWTSQEAAEFQTIAAWVRTVSASAPSPPPALDYEVFRTKIQPILLRKRPGSARCVTCHARANNFLQGPVPAGAVWTEEQSRKNFETITTRMLVVPGDPLSSRLLMMPLAHEAGGDPFHPGGKHWESPNDPEWQTMAAWVRGGERQRR